MCSSTYAPIAGQQVVVGSERIRIAARGPHGLGQADPVVIAQLPGDSRVDGTGDQAAAQARDAEPGAFLFGERRDRDRPGRLESVAAQLPERGERGHDAERAVERAPVRHGVQMAASDDGRADTSAWPSPPRPQVAVAVAVGPQPEIVRRPGEPGAAGGVGGSPGVPPVAAGQLGAAEPGQLRPQLSERHLRSPAGLAERAGLSAGRGTA